MHADSAVISSTDMKIWGVKPRIGTTGSGGSVLRHAGIFLLAAAVCCCGFAPIPKESAAALGVTKGKPITSGFVFVNGKYVKPPYLVERYGTGIRINRIQVTGQVVPWEEFLKTQPAENLVTEGDEPKAVDAESLPRQDEKEDSARRGEDTASTAKEAQAPAEVKKPEVDASAEALADLFGDGPAPAKVDESKAKAEEEAKAKAKAEEEAKSKAKAEAEAKAKEEAKDAAEEKKTKPTLTLKGKFEKNAASKRLQGRINDLRTSYDKTLRRGGALFFGDSYRAYSVNDAGSAEEMIKTLAENQKKHSEAESFCNAASVYFNFKMATDLHRNRIDYRALQERLNEINEERKLMKMLKK